MRFHVAVSDHESSDAAAAQVVAGVRADIQADTGADAGADTGAGPAAAAWDRSADGGRPDVAFLFLTASHSTEAADVLRRVWRDLEPGCLVGCTGEGVIGGSREIERAPGLALLVGQMPGVRLRPFHVPWGDWKDMLSDPAAFHERIGYGPETRAVVGFGDPFTTPLREVLPYFDQACPGAPLVGGMASAARSPGDNVLLVNDAAEVEGMVGVSLSGAVAVETVVSQGCRPIGKPLVVTKAKETVIFGLGGKTALAALREVFDQAPESDRTLFGRGPMIGRAINEYQERFARGDFLVRSLTGADEGAGALEVSDPVRVGQTVQFHVRDAASADEDLRLMLEVRGNDAPAAGGLLFSCNGRGTRMFEQPCHDVAAARRAMPQTPVAGFFAAGELGPVGGKNFIHGHTASFALFRGK